jgi:uncharacterized alpha-E superfamily protein
MTLLYLEGWNFGKLGQALERADKTSRVLDTSTTILLIRLNQLVLR